MKANLVKFVVLAVSLATFPKAVFPHHGSAAYDTQHPVTLSGKVTNFQFQNPHVLLSFEVKGDKGAEVWTGEITTPSQLARESGWTKNSLKPGDEITVTGNPSKNGTPTLIVRNVLKADGTQLRVGGGGANAQ